jgi:hypothetical protein
MLVIILLIAALIIFWVSYYTSTSVYRSLVKRDNPHARVYQVLTFLLMFAALAALIFFFVVTSLTFER